MNSEKCKSVLERKRCNVLSRIFKYVQHNKNMQEFILTKMKKGVRKIMRQPAITNEQPIEAPQYEAHLEASPDANLEALPEAPPNANLEALPEAPLEALSDEAPPKALDEYDDNDDVEEDQHEDQQFIQIQPALCVCCERNNAFPADHITCLQCRDLVNTHGLQVVHQLRRRAQDFDNMNYGDLNEDNEDVHEDNYDNDTQEDNEDVHEDHYDDNDTQEDNQDVDEDHYDDNDYQQDNEQLEFDEEHEARAAEFEDPDDDHEQDGDNLYQEEREWAEYFKTILLCDNPVSFFKIKRLVSHIRRLPGGGAQWLPTYNKLFRAKYNVTGPLDLENREELEGTLKEIRFPVEQMLQDGIAEYEKKFHKIVPANIEIEVNGDGVAACRSSNTSYFTTWIRIVLNERGSSNQIIIPISIYEKSKARKFTVAGFLEYPVEVINRLLTEGLGHRKVTFKLWAQDAVAHHEALGLKSHNAYESCPTCRVHGRRFRLEELRRMNRQEFEKQNLFFPDAQSQYGPTMDFYQDREKVMDNDNDDDDDFKSTQEDANEFSQDIWTSTQKVVDQQHVCGLCNMRMANILKNVHMNVCHKASHQIPQVYQETLLQMHNDAWEKFTFEAGKGVPDFKFKRPVSPVRPNVVQGGPGFDLGGEKGQGGGEGHGGREGHGGGKVKGGGPTRGRGRPAGSKNKSSSEIRGDKVETPRKSKDFCKKLIQEKIAVNDI